MCRCKVCDSESLYRFLSMGQMPLANSFLMAGELLAPEPVFPLDVCFCENCSLVQLVEVVPRELMFKRYIYFTSTSETMRGHFERLAQETEGRYITSPDDLFLEIASNDGCLLKAVTQCRRLGVEPATNVAAAARLAGVETFNDFFNLQTARTIRQSHGQPKVIVACNVIGHVDDLRDFFEGITELLTEDGIVIVEVPHLLELIKNFEYDTIYHEHLSYFSVKGFEVLFSRFGMKVFNVERQSVHGGSIRVYATKDPRRYPPLPAVRELLRVEGDAGLYSRETYVRFAAEVKAHHDKLVDLLRGLKAHGKRIAGYGAAAKGNTLLNYCQIGPETLDYLVDKSPYKQGLYSPGMHLPVFPVEKLVEDQPDYVLLLAWNYAEEVQRQQKLYQEQGGKFILPIPNPMILD